jgi:putative transposase
VVERLQAGEDLALTLREIALPDGTRYAVLDFMVEVPVAPLPDPRQVRRVLGWDWGVRTLVTATVLDLSYFFTVIMRGQPECPQPTRDSW